MVVDTKDYNTASDKNNVVYIELPEYDGKIKYSNLAKLYKGLKEYRK
jgi:hypothetical protein